MSYITQRNRPVFAAGIFSKIRFIDQFDNDDALAKHSGITQRKKETII